MSFQAPLSVTEMLGSIHKREYLMPAIQREFVWGPDQITKLVDSLMRGYPVGSFLLWEVEPDTAETYTFYEFLTHYHERDKPYADKATVPSGRGTTAVLDGQQRLTSLNISLYGSFAEKKKYAWWNSPDAFPAKRLYLNLLEDSRDAELGMKYDLRFLTEEEAQPAEGEVDKWFLVGDILKLDDLYAVNEEIADRGIDEFKEPMRRLIDLFRAMRDLKPMNYFLVRDQDPDRVLEIFVRVNSGGTQLSYSDLLLSMATNQWQRLDAREEVRSLVTELNVNAGRQFSFSKDLVLKTALTLAEVDVRFQVSNFTQENMLRVEDEWPAIKGALLRSATLLQSFGFNSRNLSANSAIIPVAYYLAQREASDSYLTSSRDAEDRLAIQGWVTRSLIKRGIWGSGLDTLLTRLREVLRTHSSGGFPVKQLETVMTQAGKSLTFEETEIDELLNLKYGSARTFAALSLLYPGLDFTKQFHEDHIFPRSRFTRKRLLDSGIPHEDIDYYLESVNLLPNLQLLAGTVNIEKQATLPEVWIQEAFPTDSKRETYIEENDLAQISLNLSDFMDFFEERKARIRTRLLNVLGAAGINQLVGSRK